MVDIEHSFVVKADISSTLSNNEIYKIMANEIEIELYKMVNEKIYTFLKDNSYPLDKYAICYDSTKVVIDNALRIYVVALLYENIDEYGKQILDTKEGASKLYSNL
jgi:hypothetical protein